MVGPIASVSTGVMNSLLHKLTALIEGEYRHLKSVKGGILFLRDELSSMNALLVKLSNNEERLDEQSKEWRNKVRELSYDIEDCIDLFLHEVRCGGGANASIVQNTARKIRNIWSRHKIAGVIQGLKASVVEESDRRLRYKVDDSVVAAADMSATTQIDPRLPALYVEADRLVGIDGPREKIIQWLMEDDYSSTEKLKVVSIVGFGGLGKTTLANQVFCKIRAQFVSATFVPISRNPNMKKILTDMLKELAGGVDVSDDERQLIDKLRAFLQDKRYLIIVDDIWSIAAWESLKSALPENNMCSRIITTSRQIDVAQSYCSSLEGYIHNIQPLSDEDSQKLFYKRVFQSKHCCPPHLEEVSHAIIKKCQHGLPLAIITIASLLANKISDAKEQWEQVKDSMVSVLNAQYVGDILLLSYYDLPCHLKTCFLYLSVFPEDYRIDREELIQMWIAEGFITQVKGQSLEQIGENYFNDLINRSLIQPIDMMYDGRAGGCRVHDMVLDLIISQSTEQNFTRIVEGHAFKCSSNKVRRLSLQSRCLGNGVMQEIMDRCLQIRSLISFHELDKQTFELSKFCYLRVLVLEDEDYGYLGNQQIKYLRSLIQLKYLKLNSAGITNLPNRIGHLQNLQTLDLSGSIIEKIPPTIGRLQNLVHFLVGGYYVYFPDDIGNLQALHTLSFVCPCNPVNFVGQLRRLTNLRILGIQLHCSCRDKLGDHDMERYQESLELSLTLLAKHELKSLEIDFGDYPAADKLMDSICSDARCLQKLICCPSLSRLPQRVSSLVSLAHLGIGVTKIKQEELCILGGMPSLLYVSLISSEAPGDMLTIGSQLFCCLKEFVFRTKGIGGLRMVCEREAMPMLKRFNLEFNAEESESDMGFEISFEHLASLENLSVDIYCYGATRSRVEAAEAAIRNTASIHPGRPTLQIKRWSEDLMVEDKDEKETWLKDYTTDCKEVQQV